MAAESDAPAQDGPGPSPTARPPRQRPAKGGTAALSRRAYRDDRGKRKREGGANGEGAPSRLGAWEDRKRARKAVAEPTPNRFSTEEIQAEERRPKRKVAVMIGYAGTGYKGMQVNDKERTIEGDLFKAFVDAGAISKANANDPRKSSLSRCARTDKNVHAAGNVISLKLIIEDDDIIQKINTQLPDQIRVWGIERTSNSFNAHLQCDSRWYEYLMPSYCLLPPHPQTFLGQKIAESAKEHGVEQELADRNADVKDFWSTVEDKDIRPILERLEPDVRAAVLEQIHVMEGWDTPKDREPPAGAGAAAVGGAEQEKPVEVPAPAPMPAPSHQPKGRELGPVDFALRDVKAAYTAAKRRYRISPQRRECLQSALTQYLGTVNFHNYTVDKKYGDPSARRHIKSFKVNPEPVIIDGSEWLSLKVHGQSFMMHQIRKMVGMASLVVRCGTPFSRIQESYGPTKLSVPKVPGLGLLLERPVFQCYNAKAVGELEKETIDFGKYEKEMNAFKDKQIYSRIFSVEAAENTFNGFYNQIDQYRKNSFLWVTAGGLEAAAMAEVSGQNAQKAVDKELGDEDEDNPDEGEG